jgi:hypothetical protein
MAEATGTWPRQLVYGDAAVDIVQLGSVQRWRRGGRVPSWQSLILPSTGGGMAGMEAGARHARDRPACLARRGLALDRSAELWNLIQTGAAARQTWQYPRRWRSGACCRSGRSTWLNRSWRKDCGNCQVSERLRSCMARWPVVGATGRKWRGGIGSSVGSFRTRSSTTSWRRRLSERSDSSTKPTSCWSTRLR